MKTGEKYQLRLKVLVGIFIVLFGLLFFLLIRLFFFTQRKPNAADCKDCFALYSSSNHSPSVSVPSSDVTSNSAVVPDSEPTPTPAPAVDVETVSSFQKIINKWHKIDEKYVPTDLRQVRVYANDPQLLRDEAAAKLEEMFQAAENSGITLYLISAYRSYAEQVSLYNTYLESDGLDLVETYDAHPGACEHQLGLAVDLSDENRGHDIEMVFENTPAYQWLISNSYKYGYILRYPRGKDSITGIAYNPWSFRYIGLEQAKLIYDSKLTVEEYYQFN